MRVRPGNHRTGLVLAVTLLLMMLGGQAQAWAETTTTAPADQTTISSTTTVSSATTTAETDEIGMEPPPGAIIPLAEGQTPPNPGWTTDLFEVRVLPEYDEPAVLVILRFSLPDTVPLPATVKLPIPSGSWIAGIGEIGPGGGFTYNYADSYPTVEPGVKWDIASIVVSDYRDLQVDYYYSGIPDGGGQRSFPLLVQLPVDADMLILHVQQPARSTDFLIEPALQDSGLSDDGFTYAVAAYSGLKSGDQLGNTISYVKSDGSLSIEGGTTPESSKVNTNTVLIAAILVVVIIVGGVVIYRLYAKPGPGKGKTKGRSRPRPAQPAPKTKASSRQKSGDRPSGTKSSKARTDRTASSKAGDVDYCTACGEELDDRSRFCPNCGEARP